jgi:hypothetical protein
MLNAQEHYTSTNNIVEKVQHNSTLPSQQDQLILSHDAREEEAIKKFPQLY